MAKIVTVIDIGSNSVRMVIYEKTSRFAFHLLHEEKSKVRISQDAYKNNGILQDIPMQRTFDAIKDFLQISNSFKSRKILCVATSALRDAPNKQEFIKKVKEKLKLNIKIISGEKEAYFGALSCANLLPKQKNALSVDIGGGSTEIAYLEEDTIVKTLSLKLGTVRVKELFFDKDDIAGAIKYIDQELNTISYTQNITLIGIGGTFRAISSALLKQQNYPLDKLHAYEYSLEVLNNYIEKILLAKDDNELKSLYIKNDRLDVIKSGALILSRIIKKLNISSIITSGVGVREGVYLSDLLRTSNHKFPAHYNTSVRFLIDSHIPNKEFSNNLNKLTKQIFDEVYKDIQCDKKYRKALSISAKLYPIGANIYFYSKNKKYTYYLIQNALEYGFRHKDITLIATLTKYANNKLPTRSHIQKYKELLPDTQTLYKLNYILSLAISLLSHRPKNINFQLSFQNKTLTIKTKEISYISKEAVDKLKDLHNNFEVNLVKIT